MAYSAICPAADDTVVPKGALSLPDHQGHWPDNSRSDASQHVNVIGEWVSSVLLRNSLI
jgi:hypothetical protein